METYLSPSGRVCSTYPVIVNGQAWKDVGFAVDDVKNGKAIYRLNMGGKRQDFIFSPNNPAKPEDGLSLDTATDAKVTVIAGELKEK